MAGSKMWSLMGLGATVGATIAARKAMTTTWKVATGKEPPNDRKRCMVRREKKPLSRPRPSRARVRRWLNSSGMACESVSCTSGDPSPIG